MLRNLLALAALSAASVALAEPSEKGQTATGTLTERTVQGQPLGGQFQFTPPAGAMSVRIMKSSDGDNMTTTVNEDDRTITISQGDDGIKVTVKNGDAEPKEFSAKDAETLKAESPEAYELYNQYCVSDEHGGGLKIIGLHGAGHGDNGHIIRAFPMNGGRIEELNVRCDFMPNPAVRAQIGEGVFILKVKPEGRGEKLGLKEFDYVKTVNGEAVADFEQFQEAVKKAEKLSIEVLREGKPVTLSE